ncbi:MAG TPA: cytochrome c oxidase assembly protein [Streptosporangiaceae bacterium]|nr:cytochrome c oxidase assembly protein [Streptosporangiaceae bacterium]
MKPLMPVKFRRRGGLCGRAAGGRSGVSALSPPTATAVVSTWQFAPFVSFLLIALAAAYLAGVATVRRRHPARPWPAGRTLSFASALGVIAVATQSGIGGYDEVFAVHMVQHLLLIMVAPPLLVYGRPVTLLLHATRNPVHTWVKKAVRSRVAAALTWPPFTVCWYVAVVAVTHLTPLRDLVLENAALHDAEHALYLVIGYLYFLPVIGSEPLRWKIPPFGRYLMLLAAMPADTGVGAALMLQPGRQAGGLIMVAGGDLIMTALAVALAAVFLWTPEEPRLSPPGGGFQQDSDGKRHDGHHRHPAAERQPQPEHGDRGGERHRRAGMRADPQPVLPWSASPPRPQQCREDENQQHGGRVHQHGEDGAAPEREPEEHTSEHRVECAPQDHDVDRAPHNPVPSRASSSGA